MKNDKCQQLYRWSNSICPSDLIQSWYEARRDDKWQHNTHHTAHAKQLLLSLALLLTSLFVLLRVWCGVLVLVLVLVCVGTALSSPCRRRS